MTPGTVLRMQRLFGVPQLLSCTTGSYLTFTTDGGMLYSSGAANIYQTGVQGLGVRFKVTGSPQNIYGAGTQYTLPGDTALNNILSVDVEFIIMGPLSPGVVNSSAFPVLRINVTEGSSTSQIGQFNFSGGSFVVQQPTCTTPDYIYDLLTVGLSSFTGDRQITPWINTPIKLTNCPTFYGNNSNGSRTFTDVNGSKPEELGAKQPVVLSLSLSPNTGIIDSKNGIIGLDSNSTATGIGIQIGYSTSGGLYSPQNLASTVTQNTTTGTNTPVYTFPFGARMVRTTGELTAGSVSSSATYTVTYK
jgi:Fimbrial protein.